VSRKQHYVRILPLAVASILCLALAGFILAQTQLGAVRGHGVAPKASFASLRLNRAGLAVYQSPASLDSLVVAIPVAGRSSRHQSHWAGLASCHPVPYRLRMR